MVRPFGRRSVGYDSSPAAHASYVQLSKELRVKMRPTSCNVLLICRQTESGLNFVTPIVVLSYLNNIPPRYLKGVFTVVQGEHLPKG
jgi:hypothetical protein